MNALACLVCVPFPTYEAFDARDPWRRDLRAGEGAAGEFPPGPPFSPSPQGASRHAVGAG